MAEDQNLNVPGVDHRSQGNKDEGIGAVANSHLHSRFIRVVTFYPMEVSTVFFVC